MSDLKGFSAAYCNISSFRTVKSFRSTSRAGRSNGLEKALKILNFVIPKPTKVAQVDCHQRLIKTCMQDLLIGDKKSCPNPVEEVAYKKSTDASQVRYDYYFSNNIAACWSTKLRVEEDPLLRFRELRGRGSGLDAAALSSIISSCGVAGTLDTGAQLHAFSVKVGSYGCVPIGSSLISLYSKCRKMDDAYQVFEEIAVNNTISWTAIIAGYAQHRKLEICLDLFNLMRDSNLRPNNFTYASLLSVCTNYSSLALGRSFHSLEKKEGYDAYTHVSNALISMYAKCGVIDEARYIFERLHCKDLISWNSMIFGYAHYGIADSALELLKIMEKNDISPDAITFLGVLSSCRHAGLVDEGRKCFDLMLQHGINPELDHYSCVVDLLGRAGMFEEAASFIAKMPIPPNSVIWGSLLSSCRVHGDVWAGIYAAENRLLLEPGCAATLVQLAKLYASVGCWTDVATIRKLMKGRGLKTTPGYSWIEIGHKVHRFAAEDGTNTQFADMLIVLETLGDHMQYVRYMNPMDEFDSTF